MQTSFADAEELGNHLQWLMKNPVAYEAMHAWRHEKPYSRWLAEESRFAAVVSHSLDTMHCRLCAAIRPGDCSMTPLQGYTSELQDVYSATDDILKSAVLVKVVAPREIDAASMHQSFDLLEDSAFSSFHALTKRMNNFNKDYKGTNFASDLQDVYIAAQNDHKARLARYVHGYLGEMDECAVATTPPPFMQLIRYVYAWSEYVHLPVVMANVRTEIPRTLSVLEKLHYVDVGHGFASMGLEKQSGSLGWNGWCIGDENRAGEGSGAIRRRSLDGTCTHIGNFNPAAGGEDSQMAIARLLRAHRGASTLLTLSSFASHSFLPMYGQLIKLRYAIYL